MHNFISLIPRFIEAMGTTLEVSVLAALIGIVAGFGLNAMRLALGRPFALVYGAFVWLVRGTPYLSQLVIVYFGLPVIGMTLSAVKPRFFRSRCIRVLILQSSFARRGRAFRAANWKPPPHSA